MVRATFIFANARYKSASEVECACWRVERNGTRVAVLIKAFSSVPADRYRRYLVTYPVNKAIRDSFSILYARARLT